MASAFKKPFYVAAESFKFTRMYPLNQSEVSKLASYAAVSSESDVSISALVEAPKIDYTPPSCILILNSYCRFLVEC